MLGMMSVNGIGIPTNYTAAKENYTVAAGQGVPEAYLGLGYMNLKGLGMDTNVTAAVNYFEKAAAAGVMEAHSNLGVSWW